MNKYLLVSIFVGFLLGNIQVSASDPGGHYSVSDKSANRKALSRDDTSPNTWCGTEDVDSFKLTRVKGGKSSRAYFYGIEGDDYAPGATPTGKKYRTKNYVVAGDEVLVLVAHGAWACSWFQPKEGKGTYGWISMAKLSPLKRSAVPNIEDWKGNWENPGSAYLRIGSGKTNGFLRLWGQGQSGSPPKVVSSWIEEIDISPSGDRLIKPIGPEMKPEESDQDECHLRLRLLGGYLVGEDNEKCGVAHVSFTGVYRRARRLAPYEKRAVDMCRRENSEADEDSRVSGIAKILGAKNARAYFYECEYVLPAPKLVRKEAYLISGDEVVVSGKLSDYAWVSFPKKDGLEVSGFIDTEKLDVTFANNSPSASDWFGSWEFDDGVTYSANLEIGPANGSNFLMITGSASYLFGPKEDRVKNGSINFGTIGEDDGDGEIVKPEGNKFILSPKDYEECEIKAQLVGKFLVVSDNYKCGGRNVTYSGIYWRK